MRLCKLLIHTITSYLLYLTDWLQKALTNHDLPELLRQLHPVSPDSVVNFGLHLKVDRNRIRMFENKYVGDMHQVLREILDEALKHDPPLTRIDIVNALRDPSVREERVASQIEGQYLQQLSQNPQSRLYQEGAGLVTPQPMPQSTSFPPPHAALNVAYPIPVNVQQTSEPLQWPSMLTSSQIQLDRLGPSPGVSQFHHHQHTGSSASRPPVPRYLAQDYTQSLAQFSRTGETTTINYNFWSQLPQPPHPTQHQYYGGCQHQCHRSLSAPQYLGQQDQHLPLVQDYRSLSVPSSWTPQSHSDPRSLPASGILSNSSQQPVPVSASAIAPASASTARRTVADSDSDVLRPRQQSIHVGSTQMPYRQRLNISQHLGLQDEHIALGQDCHLMDNSPVASPLVLQSHSQSSLPTSGTSSNSGQQPMLVSAGSVPRVKRTVTDSNSHSGVPAHKKPRPSSPGPPLSCLLPSPPIHMSSPESPYIQPSSTPSLPAPGITDAEVNTFIYYVKQKYRARVVERDIKWSLSPTIEYINLACIDRRCITSREYEDVTKAMVQDGNVDVIQEKKGPIEFGEIAKGIILPSNPGKDSQPVDDRRLILVEGAPGVGKSTFAWEFCRRWMEGKVAQQYNLVLLLRLRDEGIRNATSLQELISHPLPDVSTAVCRELATSDKFHALIILEGYDELPDNQRNSSSSIFNQLISGELLPFATILVTSRPWATGDIRRNYEGHIYQHIEVLGFTKRQINEYIKKNVPADQVNDLNSYLEKHPQIKCSMYIPLNTGIVVAVYKEGIRKDEDKLPNTVTELYSCCIKILISRHLNRDKSEKKESGTDLPAINISVPFEVEQNFVCMCELAHKGIVGSDKEIKLIFSDSELPKRFDDLGFMDSVTELYVTGETVSSHNFLHLTFQEFLAAVHISTMSLDKQVKYFTMSSGSMKGRLKVVLKFLAGLRKLDCFTQDNINYIVTVPSTTVSSKYLTPCDIAVDTDVVNWLFEAQSKNTISLILGESKVEFKASKSTMYPMDYYSLGYCISHSQCQWVLSLAGKMALSKEKIRVLAAGAANAVDVGTIVGLGEDMLLPNTDLDMLFTKWRSILRLNELPPIAQSLLPILDLSNLKVLEIHDKFPPLVSLPLSLCSLSINCYPRTDQECMTIASLLSSTTYLKELVYKKNMWTLRQTTSLITKALATNQLLPLENLHLHLGEMRETDMEFLTTFVRNSTTLQRLLITSSSSSTASASKLLQFLMTVYHHPTVREKSLNLGELACKVTTDADVNALNQLCSSSYQVSMSNDYIEYIGGLSDEGEIVLAEILQHKYTSQILYLSHGGTTNDGIISLAKALHHNSIIQILILTDNSISGEGAVALAQTLHHNSTLHRLELQINNIGDKGVSTLALSLHHNSTLSHLNLSNNNIGDEGASALAQSLRHNSTLSHLNLSNNSIGDEGASALAQSLHHNPTLSHLNLANSNISDEGASALAQSLHHSSALSHLNLSNNNIGDEGASALAQSLHQISTLRDLNLLGNNIGDAGASALAKSLHHNSFPWDLNLSENNIGNEGASALAQSLYQNSTLRDLNLSGNNIGDAGASALAMCLHRNCFYWDLNLSENNIGDEGANALAQSLCHSSSLRDLHLSRNNIGDEGASALVQSLHHNSSLWDLNL